MPVEGHFAVGMEQKDPVAAISETIAAGVGLTLFHGANGDVGFVVHV